METFTITDIARDCGVAYNTVHRHAQQLGVGNRRDEHDGYRFTTEEREKIIVSLATSKRGRKPRAVAND